MEIIDKKIEELQIRIEELQERYTQMKSRTRELRELRELESVNIVLGVLQSQRDILNVVKEQLEEMEKSNWKERRRYKMEILNLKEKFRLDWIDELRFFTEWVNYHIEEYNDCQGSEGDAGGGKRYYLKKHPTMKSALSELNDSLSIQDELK